MDAGQRLGRAGVDVEDTGVGVRAGEQPGVQHARHFDVVGVDRLTGRQLDGVDFRLRLADDLVGFDFGRGDDHDRRGPRPRLDVAAAAGVAVAGVPDAAEEVGRGGDGALQRFVGRQVFAAHDGRGAFDGVDDFNVAGLAVEDAADGGADFGLGWVGIALQQRIGGEDLRRRGVAGLDRAGIDERLLQRVQVARRADAFERDDLVAVRLRRQHGLRVDRLAVEQNGVGAGQAVLVAEFDAVEAGAPQHAQQPFVRLGFEGALFAVEGEGDVHGADLSGCYE